QAVLQELREKKVNAQAVRSKFEARFQFFVIAAAQYAAPALTVLLSVALCLHVGGSGSGVGAGSGAGAGGLGICNAARWAVGAQPWEEVVAAAAAAAGTAEAGAA
ncbi:unnamed protein product, partial [Laminaria digitata]